MNVLNLIGFCFLTTIASFAQAADLQLVKQRIASDMNSILGDTVNEGDGSAYVSEQDGQPVMACKAQRSRSNPNKEWFFCSVEFDVHLSSESELESRICRLIYSILNDDIATLTGDRDLESSCIENLGSE